MMVCGRSEVSSRGEFRRKFISRTICKRTLKKIVEKQKREKIKKTVISRNSETTRCLE